MAGVVPLPGWPLPACGSCPNVFWKPLGRIAAVRRCWRLRTGRLHLGVPVTEAFPLSRDHLAQ